MQCSFTIITLIRTLDTIFSIFMRRLSIYCWNINCYHISIIYSLSYIGNGLEMQHLFSIITSIYPFDMEDLSIWNAIVFAIITSIHPNIVGVFIYTRRYHISIIHSLSYTGTDWRLLYFVDKVVQILSEYSSTGRYHIWIIYSLSYISNSSEM